MGIFRLLGPFPLTQSILTHTAGWTAIYTHTFPGVFEVHHEHTDIMTEMERLSVLLGVVSLEMNTLQTARDAHTTDKPIGDI